MASTMVPTTTQWIPLYSDPGVMNKYLKKLGVPETLGVSDIISMDEAFLKTIKIPPLAILLLLPMTPKYEEYWKKHEDRMKAKNEEIKDVYYMKQTFLNGCGTVALIHAAANNESVLALQSDSVLKMFLDSTKSLSPEEKGKYLEQDKDFRALHASIAKEGQTEIPNVDEVHHHFVVFVNINGKLFELDGRKSGPIVYGNTSKDTFLKDALRVVKEYVQRDPDNLNFTALSFGAI